MIAYPEDGGDIRRSGGIPAPTPQTGGRNAPGTIPREVRVLLMVRRAHDMGMTTEEALAGTGITEAQHDAWAADPAHRDQAKAIRKEREFKRKAVAP